MMLEEFHDYIADKTIITNPEEIVGKTIIKIQHTMSTLFIVFNDNTYLAVTPKKEEYDRDYLYLSFNSY